MAPCAADFDGDCSLLVSIRGNIARLCEDLRIPIVILETQTRYAPVMSSVMERFAFCSPGRYRAVYSSTINVASIARKAMHVAMSGALASSAK